MFYRISPFMGFDKKMTYANIQQVRFEYKTDPQISDAAKDLLNRIFVTDPLLRLTWEEMSIHPFLTLE